MLSSNHNADNDSLFTDMTIYNTEFSLARFGVTFANNSVIDINLVGEGYLAPNIEQTDSGALECHIDDTTCCRGTDNPPNGTGRGEWYYPDGTVVPPPGGDSGFYRTRDHMVVRLNRPGGTLPQTGVYRCVLPGAEGVNINRYIELVKCKLSRSRYREVQCEI